MRKSRNILKGKQMYAGFIATTFVLGTAVPTAFATTTESVKLSTVQVDGKVLSRPYQIVSPDSGRLTTYLPLYYVEQALEKAGYKSSWNGETHTWALTTNIPNLDFSQLKMGSGNTTVTVNGIPVKRLSAFSRKDPAGGPHGGFTTYIPIYYVQALFDAAGIREQWNGNVGTWNVTTPLTLSTNTTYGPSSGSTDINKNVNILGTNSTLQNATVDGNVYVNPGEYGSVYLKNVKVTGAIVVLSGAPHSIHLQNVSGPSLQVASSTEVHITAEDNTAIDSTDILTGDKQSVDLDQISGLLGTVTVHAKQSVTLSGTKPYSRISLQSEGKLTIATDASVNQLEVGESEGAVTISSGANVTGLTVDSSAINVSLTNDGTIIMLTNKAPSDSVTLQGPGTVSNTDGNTPTTTTTPDPTGAVSAPPTIVAVPLKAPSGLQVSTTSSVATWEPVSHAVGYTVDVYDSNGQHVTSDDTWLLNRSNLATMNLPSGTYTITVTARGDGKYFVDSQPSVKSNGVTVTALDAPQVTVNTTGIASWPTVANATAYELQVQSENGDPVAGVSLDQTQNPSVDLNSLGVPSLSTGTYDVVVQAIGGQKYTNSTGKCTLQNFTNSLTPLATPTGLCVTNNTLTWDDVNGATSYNIVVYDTQGKVKTSYFNWSGSSFDFTNMYNLTNGDYQVSVMACAESTGFAGSAPSQRIPFTYSGASATTSPVYSNVPGDVPQNIQVSGTTVTWSAVSNATKYNYTVFRSGTGETVDYGSTTSTSFDLATDTRIPQYGDFVVWIAAVGTSGYPQDVCASEISRGPAPALQLAAPAPTLSGNVLNWASVPNAVSYEVKTYDYSGNCEFKFVTGGATSYTIPIYGSPSVYYTSVTAVGDGTHYADSDESPLVTVNVQQLPTPQNIRTNGTVVSWDAVPNAYQYDVYIVSNHALSPFKSIPQSATSIDLASLGLTPGGYNILVEAIPTSGTLVEPSESVSSAFIPVGQAGTLQATASPGSATGSTSVAATPMNNDSLYIKVVSTPTGIVYSGSALPTSAQPYTSGADIAGVSVGQYVDVYNVDSFQKVVSFLEIPLTSTNLK